MPDVLVDMSVASVSNFEVDTETVWPLNGIQISATSSATAGFGGNQVEVDAAIQSISVVSATLADWLAAPIEIAGLSGFSSTFTMNVLTSATIQASSGVTVELYSADVDFNAASESSVTCFPGVNVDVDLSVQATSLVDAEFLAVVVDASISSASALTVTLSYDWPESPITSQSTSSVSIRRLDVLPNPAVDALRKPGLVDVELIDRLGQLADWKFEVNFGDRQDNTVWSGTGVSYLDRLASTYVDHTLKNPRFNVRLDVTVKGFSSSWSKINLNDIENLRAAFVKYYGEVDRIDEWSNNV